MAGGKLIHQQYGKARVRVLKVFRRGARHDLKEVEVAVTLLGNFSTAYTRGDNSRVVPTDTMKNTVLALAQDFLGAEIEGFGLALGRHFLRSYPQVREARLRLRERSWERLAPGGRPHSHSFREHGRAVPFTEVVCTRRGSVVTSGIEELLILKSTGSGFEGYPKDEFTTLAETRDRILATNLTAAWQFRRAPASYAAANARVLDAMLGVFARNYSPSVQATLYQMAEAALRAVPAVGQVRLSMPNKHCLLANLKPFGRENRNEVFIPTDEPHGQIEATVARR
jgi:urate oxidase